MVIIGIDLGTTNSTLSYMDKNQVKQFSILQPFDRKSDKKMLSLPSFYYFPLPEEERDPFVGFYAKEKGSELPDRIISSAKSWLCHPHVDKRQPFLPLNSDIESKISPQDACVSFLKHLKDSWNLENPLLSFTEQNVVITVPASFEPMSRQLIYEAVEKIGCKEFILLEEPLAAFYAWLNCHEEDWKEHLKIKDSVLIVDVGGGTTDFSLITVEEKEGTLHLERKAVGNHLLLGGDNIDLTLAFYLQTKLGEELDFMHFQAFVHKCRDAKEKLLSEDSVEEYQIVLPGRGSRLIGGAKTVTLTREEVEHYLVNGFFPDVSFDQKPEEQMQLALKEVGLSFAKDPRISVHLAHFLSRFPDFFPNKVLFNGGSMKARAFQQRILQLLEKWGQREISLLCTADLDFAVSKGAAYYGWTNENRGIRVRAETVKNYYIGVESARPAVPGLPSSIKAVCVAPKGMQEGSETTLESMKFTLFLDETAKFRFFSSDQEAKEVGEITSLEGLVELHPIETILEKQGIEEKMIAIQLKSKITELGMLEIWCEKDSEKKWKLEFDVRKSNDS